MKEERGAIDTLYGGHKAIDDFLNGKSNSLPGYDAESNFCRIGTAYGVRLSALRIFTMFNGVVSSNENES
jgi:hypothetical protein